MASKAMDISVAASLAAAIENGGPSGTPDVINLIENDESVEGNAVSIENVVPSVADSTVMTTENLSADVVAAEEDFVALFREQGFDHLTREIFLLLISPADEPCSLTEAKLVSSAWRQAVDKLVLETDLGKSSYTQRIKDVMRRFVRSLRARSESVTATSCSCLRLSIKPLENLLEAPREHLICWAVYADNAKIHHLNGSKCRENLSTDLTWIIRILMSDHCPTHFQRYPDNMAKSILLWKEMFLKVPVSDSGADDQPPLDDDNFYSLGLRATLTYRLRWFPRDKTEKPFRVNYPCLGCRDDISSMPDGPEKDRCLQIWSELDF